MVSLLTLVPIAGLACLTVLLAADHALARESGLQVTRGERRVLVSKDVGDARWAIVYDRHRATAVGTVFAASGAPGFVFCQQRPIGAVFDCYGARPCDAARCTSDYTALGAVELPADFFDPASADTASAADAAPAAAAPAEGRGSGIQWTPDGLTVLVNKDVDDARWAITYNLDDGSLTGNVFHPDGGPPIFVHCDPIAPPSAFACFGATSCVEADCTAQYAFLGDVTLPDGFLGPTVAACGDAVEEPGERCEPDFACNVLCGVDRFCTIGVGAAPAAVPGRCVDDCRRCEAADGAPGRGAVLGWTPAPGALTYVVHWGMTSGAYQQSLIARDPSIQDGVVRFTVLSADGPGVYYFAVSAVDGTGRTSAPSNEIAVTLP